MAEDADSHEAAPSGPRLDRDQAHFRACHERWVKALSRSTGDPGYRDEWYAQQCGGCRYFLKLPGAFRFDWGVCSNAASPRDGRATFEHDGCEAFAAAEEGWG